MKRALEFFIYPLFIFSKDKFERVPLNMRKKQNKRNKQRNKKQKSSVILLTKEKVFDSGSKG